MCACFPPPFIFSSFFSCYTFFFLFHLLSLFVPQGGQPTNKYVPFNQQELLLISSVIIPRQISFIYAHFSIKYTYFISNGRLPSSLLHIDLIYSQQSQTLPPSQPLFPPPVLPAAKKSAHTKFDSTAHAHLGNDHPQPHLA